MLDKFERKISGKGAVRAGKAFILLISNENRSVTRKIRSIYWQCNWNKKAWNKKQEDGILGALMTPMAASLIAYMASSLINGMTVQGVMRAGNWPEDGSFLLSALSFMMKILGKRIIRVARRYNNTSHMDKQIRSII